MRKVVVAPQLAQHAIDARARDHRGERVGRPAFALVRLVEHGDVVGRQQPAAHRQIEKEERVIDDDYVGILRFVALFEEKTVAKVRADFPDALVGVGIELLPLAAVRREAEFGTIAALRPLGPLPNLLHRVRLRDEPVGAHAFELLAAEVVRAPLEQRDAQRTVERALDQRNVLTHELLLQRDRPGREHDLLTAADRRHEIGERLSDAGAGFDDGVQAFQDAALDGLRHLQLPGTWFVSIQRPRKWALGAENLLEVNGQRPAVRIRRAARVPQRRRRPVRRDAAERKAHRSIQTRRRVRRRGLATQSPAR